MPNTSCLTSAPAASTTDHCPVLYRPDLPPSAPPPSWSYRLTIPLLRPLVQFIEQAYRPYSGVEWHFACSMRSKWRHRAGESAPQPPGKPLALLDELHEERMVVEKTLRRPLESCRKALTERGRPWPRERLPKERLEVCKTFLTSYAGDWIDSYAAHELQKLLSDQRLTLTDIVDAMHFSSQPALTRYMKRVMHTTPSEFRQNSK